MSPLPLGILLSLLWEGAICCEYFFYIIIHTLLLALASILCHRNFLFILLPQYILNICFYHRCSFCWEQQFAWHWPPHLSPWETQCCHLWQVVLWDGGADIRTHAYWLDGGVQSAWQRAGQRRQVLGLRWLPCKYQFSLIVFLPLWQSNENKNFTLLLHKGNCLYLVTWSQVLGLYC